MKQSFIPLCFFVIISFFITPCYAIDFINGDFETGNTCPDNWSCGGVGMFRNSSVSYNGDYCIMQQTSDSYGTAYQNIDLTNVDTIYFYTKQTNFINGWTLTRIQFSNGVYYSPWFAGVHDWTLRSWDVSGYTGVQTIGFKTLHKSAPGYTAVDYVYCDTPPPPPNSTITFYPDVDESATLPTAINYTINTDDEIYDNYVWVTTFTSVNSTHDYSQPIFIGYADGTEGSFDISNLWPYGMWYDNIEYIQTSLMSEKDAPIWTDPRPTTPPYLIDYLDYDYMTYNQSFEIEIPDPEPTPNPTPQPTPSPTTTPQPTPTPQSTPQVINESLNTNFTIDYYNLVDNTVDGFFTPVYNFTDYIISPLSSFNSTLNNFSVNMNDSFTTSNSSIVLGGKLMLTIFAGFPPKIINVIIYYLIWLIIILIFKGDT